MFHASVAEKAAQSCGQKLFLPVAAAIPTTGDRHQWLMKYSSLRRRTGWLVTQKTAHRHRGLINTVWRLEMNWQTKAVIPVFEKGVRKVCSNFRGIIVLSFPGKVYTRVLERRMVKTWILVIKYWTLNPPMSRSSLQSIWDQPQRQGCCLHNPDQYKKMDGWLDKKDRGMDG